MLDAIERIAVLVTELVAELESSDEDKSSYLNSDGDTYQTNISDEAAGIIDELEQLLPTWFSDGTELNEEAVNIAATYDLEVRKVTNNSDFKEEYDFVLCTPVGKIYFN